MWNGGVVTGGGGRGDRGGGHTSSLGDKTTKKELLLKFLNKILNVVGFESKEKRCTFVFLCDPKVARTAIEPQKLRSFGKYLKVSRAEMINFRRSRDSKSFQIFTLGVNHVDHNMGT